jgi:hypothetical protein
MALTDYLIPGLLAFFLLFSLILNIVTTVFLSSDDMKKIEENKDNLYKANIASILVIAFVMFYFIYLIYKTYKSGSY